MTDDQIVAGSPSPASQAESVTPVRSHPANSATQRISADVQMGQGVVVRDFVNLYGCTIGEGTRVGTFVEIQKGSRIGRNCKISSHTFICEGVTLEDNVFIGHGVMFTNDLYPRATTLGGMLQADSDWQCLPTLVRRGASIGSGATLLCGIIVGEGAIVGAGSVVTKDVPAHIIVAGNPARPLRPVAGPKDPGADSGSTSNNPQDL